jgi:hypothetical protein
MTLSKQFMKKKKKKHKHFSTIDLTYMMCFSALSIVYKHTLYQKKKYTSKKIMNPIYLLLFFKILKLIKNYKDVKTRIEKIHCFFPAYEDQQHYLRKNK